ncbi:glutamate--cysteine ligase [Recurvomyces mirabilis]|nr:glutamate--cysteine ligase [Recurvomyces mirabilis]
MVLTRTRPRLPALRYLDLDQVKPENGYCQNRNTGAPLQSFPPVPAACLSCLYPPSLPPDHNQTTPALPENANVLPGAQKAAHTPPESRCVRGKQYDVKQRRWISSDSEALNVDFQTSLDTATTVRPQSAIPSLQPHAQAASGPTAPRSGGKKQYDMELPPLRLLDTANWTAPPYSLLSPLQVPPSQAIPSSLHPAYNDPENNSWSIQKYSSADSAEPSSSAYGYIPSASRLNHPKLSWSDQPLYQPAANYLAAPIPSTSWRVATSIEHTASDQSNETGEYSASGKKRSNSYHLESALNQIGDLSSTLLNFSRRYEDALHQTACAQILLAAAPGILELNDMIEKARYQAEVLMKIREVVCTQQAAFDQELAEQRPTKRRQ